MKKVPLEKYFIALSKDSFVYGIGNMVLKILSLISIPIITRVFNPDEYGIINLIASVTALLSLIMIFGMDSALPLSYYQYKKEKKAVFSSGFWFLIMWAIIVVGVATIYSSQIASFFLKSKVYTNLLLIGYFASIFTLITNYSKIVLQLEFKAKTFAILSAINAILIIGLIILFIAGFHFGLNGYFTGSLLGTALGFFLTIYFVRSNIIFKISRPRLVEMIAYGALLVPASLSTYVFDLSDRYFISHYWNLRELGLYSMAFNITMMISFFSIALGQAWSPFIMKMYFTKRVMYKRFLSRVFSYLLLFFSILAVLVYIFSKEILGIFTTSQYFEAYRAIPPLAIAAVFSASIQITALGISISRKTKYIAIHTIITAILNTILNFLLIPKYGMVGAGWSTAISYFFLTGLYLTTSQKLIAFPVAWVKILKLAVITGLVIFLSSFFWDYNFWGNLIIKIIEFGVYLTLLYLIGVIEKEEILYVGSKLKEIRNKYARR